MEYVSKQMKRIYLFYDFDNKDMYWQLLGIYVTHWTESLMYNMPESHNTARNVKFHVFHNQAYGMSSSQSYPII